MKNVKINIAYNCSTKSINQVRQELYAQTIRQVSIDCMEHVHSGIRTNINFDITNQFDEVRQHVFDSAPISNLILD